MAGMVREAGRELAVAVPLAVTVGSIAVAFEVRHQARWHPGGLGLGACEAGVCRSRGSARGRWARRLVRIAAGPGHDEAPRPEKGRGAPVDQAVAASGSTSPRPTTSACAVSCAATRRSQVFSGIVP
jgi:hypothetical protein